MIWSVPAKDIRACSIHWFINRFKRNTVWVSGKWTFSQSRLLFWEKSSAWWNWVLPEVCRVDQNECSWLNLPSLVQHEVAEASMALRFELPKEYKLPYWCHEPIQCWSRIGFQSWKTSETLWNMIGGDACMAWANHPSHPLKHVPVTLSSSHPLCLSYKKLNLRYPPLGFLSNRVTQSWTSLPLAPSVSINRRY